jgi:hypothetical protein
MNHHTSTEYLVIGGSLRPHPGACQNTSALSLPAGSAPAFDRLTRLGTALTVTVHGRWNGHHFALAAIPK